MPFGLQIIWILQSVATSTVEKYKRFKSTKFWLDTGTGVCCTSQGSE